jgi:hypothetical protein
MYRLVIGVVRLGAAVVPLAAVRATVEWLVRRLPRLPELPGTWRKATITVVVGVLAIGAVGWLVLT